MLKKRAVLVKGAALALCMGLSVGCTTTEQYRQMQADIAKTQETADAALAAAQRAEVAAADAQSQADTAESAASRAQRTATAASEAAARCEEKCNRMMQKAVRK